MDKGHHTDMPQSHVGYLMDKVHQTIIPQSLVGYLMDKGHLQTQSLVGYLMDKGHHTNTVASGLFDGQGTPETEGGRDREL